MIEAGNCVATAVETLGIGCAVAYLAAGVAAAVITGLVTNATYNAVSNSNIYSNGDPWWDSYIPAGP